jgi:alanine-glyoxylate transaminase/serine-glyoxylate transaminase/serine-pyruvate transaminase
MSLANGRHYLAIPGPSVMPDRVLNAMHRAAPNIYTGELHEIVAGLIPDLKAVARTAASCGDLHLATATAPGRRRWPTPTAAATRALVLATGGSALGWSEVAKGLGIDCEMSISASRRRMPIWPGSKRLLAADTGTGSIRCAGAGGHLVLGPQRHRRAAAVLDRTGHPALLMVDCIACLACDRFEMDGWGVDVMVTGSQKGLMTPPGLGFVFFNDKAGGARARPIGHALLGLACRAPRPRSSTSISTAPRRRITSTGCAPRST